MENFELNRETEDWLLAYLNGEFDEREEIEVEGWLKESPENREAYESLLGDYLQLRWAQEAASIREDRARRVIFSSLRKRRSCRLYYGVVASVAFLLILVGGLFMKERVEVSPEPMASLEIKPVRPQALLVLSSGEQVDLGLGRRDIRECDGSLVRVDSCFGIHYDSLAGTSRGADLIYNKIIVPRGGEYFLKLSDGTEVWLDAESELEYPVNFMAGEREVKLKGEAYFSVVEDKEKAFVVRSGEYAVRVYGTEFNVNAYDSRQIETVLVKGVIGFKANSAAVERMLKPNELAVANMETGESRVRQVDVYPYVAWKNQDIVFVNERLESIMEKVSRWYDMAVFFQNEDLKDLRFDCNMRRYSDIKDLFFFMEKTSDTRFTINGRVVVVSKK